MATAKKKDSFGIDADPAEFDIEEWLSGASLPARTVTIYQNAGLRAEYDALEQKFLLAQSQLNFDDDKAQDVSLAVSAPEAALFDLAKKMQQMLSELEKSALRVKVRAITRDEELKVQEDTKKRKLDGDHAGYERLSIAAIHPPLNPEGWKRMRQAIGEVQYADIATAVSELAGFVTGGQVMPDFSPNLSALLSTKDS